MTARTKKSAAKSDTETEALPLGESLQALQVQAQELVLSASQVSQEGTAWLRDEARERPLTTLGLAAACGFLLGGGLPSPLRRGVLALAGRYALHRLQAQAGSLSSAPNPSTTQEKMQ